MKKRGAHEVIIETSVLNRELKCHFIESNSSGLCAITDTHSFAVICH